MIDFNYENEYNLDNEEAVGNWLSTVIFCLGRKKEKSTTSSVTTNTCINLEYLNHDTLTDVISFDYTKEMKLVEIFLFLWNVFRITLRILMSL
jgi:ssRNA-specific RNase YbeY (16S rRNA maturation enzyme)